MPLGEFEIEDDLVGELSHGVFADGRSMLFFKRYFLSLNLRKKVY